jgi:membrane protein implicated in regulation of membrane protease activity
VKLAVNLLGAAANTPNPPGFTIWIIVGFIFLLLGMTVGEPTAASLGVAAIITAIASLTVTSVSIQLILWGILSIALTIVLRGMVPTPTRETEPETHAIVSETIPQGGIGWVSYEGALWKARCQISDVTLTANEMVQVVGRQGLTLIVLPMEFPEEYDSIS